MFSNSTLAVAAVDSTISGNRAGDGGIAAAGGNGGNGGSGGFVVSGGTNGGTGGATFGGFGGSGGAGGGASGIKTVDRSTISDNAAGDGGDGADGGNGGSGGAPFGTGAAGSGGPTFGGFGSPGGSGGGLLAPTGSSVTNTTITRNSAGQGGNGGKGGTGPGASFGGFGGAGGSGGGVRSVTNVVHATISANRAGKGGAAGGAGTGTPSFAGNPGAAGTGGGASAGTLKNTIVANNTPANCATVTNGGNNLSFPDISCVGLNADPKLGPLADNGGPTKTRALGAGSAALDKVPATGANCTATDQRSVTRPRGTACDIGAYEVAPPVVTTGVASKRKARSATVAGTVNPSSRATTVQFDFGLTAAYGDTTPTQTVAGGITDVAVSANLTGLLPGRTYHYRLAATNGDGSAVGADATFRTLFECVVPRLKGKQLAAAKKLLRRAHCRLGKVTRKQVLRGKTGRVLSQKPKAGTRKPAGFKVRVVLSKLVVKKQ
ncbi:MAG: PASTA domain-containing protein [Actinomycetota bacterium]|nr:PASTA domain-containing protein [Actinomycetota bacterium]MDQ2984414.1 PASTA domain-containing protein [Actinomycetota bacterium]